MALKRPNFWFWILTFMIPNDVESRYVFRRRWRKKPWPPISPFLLFYFAKYHVRQSDYFSSNKQTKNPSQYPLLKNSWWIHEKSMMKKSIKYKKIIDYWTTRHPSYVLKYDYIISSYYNFNQFNVFFPVCGWCIFFPFIKMIEFQFLKIGTYTIIT